MLVKASYSANELMGLRYDFPQAGARMVTNRSRLSSYLLSGYDASQPPEVAEGLSVDVQLAVLNFVDISTAQENIQLHAWYARILRIHASSSGVDVCADGILYALAHVAYHLGSHASCR